jgi:hypothetical protein
MALRPEIPNLERLSRGYKVRMGYGDALNGLPRFYTDTSYIDGYERGLADVHPAPVVSATAEFSEAATLPSYPTPTAPHGQTDRQPV